jgi:hypothetical protein
LSAACRSPKRFRRAFSEPLDRRRADAELSASARRGLVAIVDRRR